MRFTVTNADTQNGMTTVTGETPVGMLAGVWHDRNAPVPGRAYQIELEFGTVDREAVTAAQTEMAEIRVSGDTVVFTAECEDYDEVYYLRFSADGLSMLDIANDHGTFSPGMYLTFSRKVSEVGIYPYL